MCIFIPKTEGSSNIVIEVDEGETLTDNKFGNNCYLCSPCTKTGFQCTHTFAVLVFIYIICLKIHFNEF